VKSQDVVPSIQLEEADACEAINSCPEDRADSRKNAPMTPAGRLRMVQAVLNGEPARSVALRLATDRKTVRKWMVRYVSKEKRMASPAPAAASAGTTS
jgi:transposase-like protein